MEKIVILGKGGHARSIIDAIERQREFEIVGYIVNEVDSKLEAFDYSVIGNDDDLQSLFDQGITNAAIGIGFLGKSKLREALFWKLKEIGYSLPVICDPSAIISDRAVIEEGCFIGKGAIINASAQIGKMCIINTGAIVEHNCHVEDFSHISIGTVLCGEVKVGRETFVGANSTVIQGKSIGNRCIIAAGSVVRKSIKDGEVCW